MKFLSLVVLVLLSFLAVAAYGTLVPVSMVEARSISASKWDAMEMNSRRKGSVETLKVKASRALFEEETARQIFEQGVPKLQFWCVQHLGPRCWSFKPRERRAGR